MIARLLEDDGSALEFALTFWSPPLELMRYGQVWAWYPGLDNETVAKSGEIIATYRRKSHFDLTTLVPLNQPQGEKAA